MTGEVGEAIQDRRPPPPFHESVAEPAIAGDLTCEPDSLESDREAPSDYLTMRLSDSLTVAGQRRIFTGFAANGRDMKL